MKLELIKQIQMRSSAYESVLVQQIERYAYEKERYNIEYAIAVGATIKALDVKGFSETVRMTDSFIMLDDNMYAVVFASASTELGIKAASNLLHKFEMQFFTSKIFLGIISSQAERDPKKMVRKLFTTLSHSIAEGMCNMPIDYEHIADESYAI